MPGPQGREQDAARRSSAEDVDGTVASTVAGAAGAGRDEDSSIAAQEEAHDRIARLLDVMIAELRQEQPSLGEFIVRRPARERHSGVLWQGLETMCLVSELMASVGTPGWRPGELAALVAGADAAARSQGFARCGDTQRGGLRQLVWDTPQGDLLEVVIGVRLSVRATSAPYLPETDEAR